MNAERKSLCFHAWMASAYETIKWWFYRCPLMMAASCAYQCTCMTLKRRSWLRSLLAETVNYKIPGPNKRFILLEAYNLGVQTERSRVRWASIDAYSIQTVDICKWISTSGHFNESMSGALPLSSYDHRADKRKFEASDTGDELTFVAHVFLLLTTVSTKRPSIIRLFFPCFLTSRHSCVWRVFHSNLAIIESVNIYNTW